MPPSMVLFSNAWHRHNVRKRERTMKTPTTRTILLASLCAALGAALPAGRLRDLSSGYFSGVKP